MEKKLHTEVQALHPQCSGGLPHPPLKKIGEEMHDKAASKLGTCIVISIAVVSIKEESKMLGSFLCDRLT